MAELTHIDSSGSARMVDISDKDVTRRQATATATLYSQQDVIALLEQAAQKKGDVIATARVAGIMAAKRTSDLIPLCHPLPLNKVAIEISPDVTKGTIAIAATCVTEGKTGIEMEALTAASVTALTLYDMCKAVDPSMVITDIKLIEKTGGKSGHWQRGQEGVSND